MGLSENKVHLLNPLVNHAHIPYYNRHRLGDNYPPFSAAQIG